MSNSHLVCVLQGLSAFDENPVDGTDAGADHDSGGGGQAQGAGAGNGKDCQSLERAR